MTVETLLNRLDKLRKTGAGRWVCRCPAHDDKGPSLAIRELEDGRVLLHCFAGCEPISVLDALGLTFTDLFPEQLTQGHMKRERRPFIASDVLRCLAFESLFIYQCATSISKGKQLPQSTMERLLIAASRFQHGVEVANA